VLIKIIIRRERGVNGLVSNQIEVLDKKFEKYLSLKT